METNDLVKRLYWFLKDDIAFMILQKSLRRVDESISKIFVTVIRYCSKGIFVSLMMAMLRFHARGISEYFCVTISVLEPKTVGFILDEQQISFYWV